MIKLFVNSVQIRLLNGKTTDLDWYFSRHHHKLKFPVYDLLSKSFVKDSNGEEGQSYVATIVFLSQFPVCNPESVVKIKYTVKYNVTLKCSM